MKKIKIFRIIGNSAYNTALMSMLLVFLFAGNVSASNENTYKDSVSESIVKARDTVVDKIKLNNDQDIIRKNKNITDERRAFSDIDKNPYKYAINVLQEKHLVKGYEDKYFPGNHVRMYMLLNVLVNSYRFSIHANGHLNSEKCMENAYNMGLLNNLNTDDFEKIIKYSDFKQVLSNFAYQYPALVNSDIVDQIPDNDENLTKDRMAYYLVSFFSMLPESREGEEVNIDYYFQDTAYHIFGDDVEFLAKKGIITVQNDNFFIDKLASRADLVVLMANTLLSLRDEDLSEYDHLESDVIDTVGKKYESQVIYTRKQGLLDYLLETKRGKTYLYPQKLLSKHEAFYLLGLAADKKLDYNIESADNEDITRGELAHAILDVFDFSNSYKYKYIKHNSAGISGVIDDSEFVNNSIVKTIGFISKIRGFLSGLNNIKI